MENHENTTIPEEKPSEQGLGRKLLNMAQKLGFKKGEEKQSYYRSPEERKALREQELAQLRGRKVLKTTPFTSEYLDVDDFKDLYPDWVRKRNERYARERRRTNEVYEYEDSAAKVFERVFVRGIQVGRWLGNTGGAPGDDRSNFTTQTFVTTDYDDIRHRVDVFSTLKFNKRLENDAGVNFTMLPMAFDLTINGSRSKIVDKLIRSCNDDEKLPFGFTHLDYFTDGKRVINCPIIPRYVIGVSEHEINILREQEERQQENQHTDVQSLPFTKQNLRMRFKVLSEIRAQNELYEAMLPENAYENPSPNVRIARACIEAADRQLSAALNQCAQTMVAYKAIPARVIDEIKENPLRTRTIIEDFLIDEGKRYYNKNLEDKRFAYDGKQRKTEYSDAFVQIMTQVRALTEAARNGGSKRFPQIDELRAEQPRNGKVIFHMPKASGE